MTSILTGLRYHNPRDFFGCSRCQSVKPAHPHHHLLPCSFGRSQTPFRRLAPLSLLVGPSKHPIPPRLNRWNDFSRSTPSPPLTGRYLFTQVLLLPLVRRWNFPTRTTPLSTSLNNPIALPTTRTQLLQDPYLNPTRAASQVYHVEVVETHNKIPSTSPCLRAACGYQNTPRPHRHCHHHFLPWDPHSPVKSTPFAHHNEPHITLSLRFQPTLTPDTDRFWWQSKQSTQPFSPITFIFTY